MCQIASLNVTHGSENPIQREAPGPSTPRGRNVRGALRTERIGPSTDTFVSLNPKGFVFVMGGWVNILHSSGSRDLQGPWPRDPRNIFLCHTVGQV